MFKPLVRLVNCIAARNYTTKFKSLSISDVFSVTEPSGEIKIQGWVKALRKMKDNVFIDVSDGSCDQRLQILISSQKKPQTLTIGCSILASGHLSTTPQGQVELAAHEISVIGPCIISDGYPFAPRKSYPPEYIREYLHLRPRTQKFAALLRVRHCATKAIHDHFHSEGYFSIHTPILTSNDCEGAGEVFSIQPENKKLLKSMVKDGVSEDKAYFDTKVFLTVSGQLHLEAIAHGLSKVYTFGPTFRAENSKSRLHLSEFYMVEAEKAFIDDLKDLADTVQKLIKNITKDILNNCATDIASIQGREHIDLSWVDKSFVTVTFDEAFHILEKNRKMINSPVDKNQGFTKEQEVFLVEFSDGVPVFVTEWPKENKPFYMKDSKQDPNKVAAFDLLGPHVGEIVGGSLRENDHDKLVSKLPPGKSALDWYLELRKFGGVPTGGFGLGFERYLQMLLGITNIKDTIPFPRVPHSCRM